MTIKVRFAPSPTGNIHIGNARPALINWLFAKQRGGEYLLRYDDTDVERSKLEYAEGIARDLHWLGIQPDAVEWQSKRSAIHQAATDRLIASGLLYPCFETPDELDRRRKRQAARGLPPIYDRAALKLTSEERSRLESEGRNPHWRFLLPNPESDPFSPRRTEFRWDDLVRGEEVVDLASVSDPVLVREDGTWLYTLPSVVDDIDLGVTHIIRGDDHVTNTGVQIALFEALGAKAPVFGHLNLLTTASGEGLSKRLGSLSLKSLADDGFEPMAVASLAVLIGGAGPVEPMRDMAALAERFDITKVGKSAAKFDTAELDALNARLVHGFEWMDVEPRFSAGAFGPEPEVFWNAIRGNISRVREAGDWWERLMRTEPEIASEDRDFIALALDLLPPEPWTATTWGEWTGALKEKSGRKGKTLFMPLRKALTGLEHGPEMASLLPVIGRERTLARLS
ncbi:MAG TPA: glutamate--tRNA ligase [Rhizobiaceae bacterium]|nr:glutamate--tRNA ligase [Rhizobiaceae bacterium]